jgi:hypothetical protein
MLHFFYSLCLLDGGIILYLGKRVKGLGYVLCLLEPFSLVVLISDISAKEV